MSYSTLRIEQAAMKTAQSILPKNLSEYTFLLIWNYVREHIGTVTAEQVAQGVGVSRTTARRYLEYCVEQGMVERVLSYLQVGRPVHRFQRSNKEGRT